MRGMIARSCKRWPLRPVPAKPWNELHPNGRLRDRLRKVPLRVMQVFVMEDCACGDGPPDPGLYKAMFVALSSLPELQSLTIKPGNVPATPYAAALPWLDVFAHLVAPRLINLAADMRIEKMQVVILASMARLSASEPTNRQ